MPFRRRYGKRRRYSKRRRFGKRRFGRRRHWRSRGTFKRIARKVRHLAKGVELHRTEFEVTPPIEITNNITLTNQTNYLWPIPVGDSTFTRTGSRVFVKYVDFQIMVQSGAGSGIKNFFNIYVVRKKATNVLAETNPGTTALFSPGAGASPPTMDWRTFNYRNDYRIVKQIKSWVDPTTVWCSNRRYSFRLKVNKVLEWTLTNTDGELDELRKNAYWLIFRGDYGTGDVSCPDITKLSWVVRFTDY